MKRNCDTRAQQLPATGAGHASFIGHLINPIEIREELCCAPTVALNVIGNVGAQHVESTAMNNATTTHRTDNFRFAKPWVVPAHFENPITCREPLKHDGRLNAEIFPQF